MRVNPQCFSCGMYGTKGTCNALKKINSSPEPCAFFKTAAELADGNEKVLTRLNRYGRRDLMEQYGIANKNDTEVE